MIFENNDRIVFAGDSVTDGGSKCPVAEGVFDELGKGYVRIFESLMNVFYPEINLRVNNSGVSGNTSRDLLRRFEQDVTGLNPDWISICVGINDVWRQFDCPAITTWSPDTNEYRENMIKMIEMAKATAKKGVFILTPYYMEPNKNDPMRAKMDEYSQICRELAREYNCPLVDFQDMYDRYFKFQHSAFIAWDRVHPNQRGAMLMACEFLKYCGFEYEFRY